VKKILLLLFFITSLFSSELNWIHNYKKALTVAKKEHKDIYLFIGADKCRFCKKFKEKTLSQKQVINKLDEKFIPLYLSRDQHIVPDKFEKYGAPRHYFLNSNGKIYDEDAGYIAPEAFIKFLDEVSFYRD